MFDGNVRFIRYRHYDRKGKLKADYGWRLCFWRFYVRYNRQANYVAFEFGRKCYKIMDVVRTGDDV